MHVLGSHSRGCLGLSDELVAVASASGKTTPQDVDEISAGWMDRLPIDHRFDQGARLIDAAFRAVKMDLRGVDLSIADVAESEIIDVLTAYMAAAKLDPTLMDDYTRKQQLIAPVQRVNVRDATGAAQKSYGVSLTRR